MLRVIRNVGAVLLLAALALTAACIYEARDAQQWIQTDRGEDGSYTRIKIVSGVYDQEIHYRADGSKKLHCYTDSTNAVHRVYFDEGGAVISHDVSR
jgi:hypothetical protein